MTLTARQPGSTPSTPGPIAADPRLLPWLVFIQAHSAVTRAIEAELQATDGISLADFDALIQLALAGGQLRMSELADRVLLSRSGVSRLVDRLVTEGLVERRACPTDARVSWATLTDQGRDRLECASPVHLRGVETHFLAAIDPADREVMVRALEAVFRHVRGLPSDTSCLASTASVAGA